MLRPSAEAKPLLKGTRSYQDPVLNSMEVLLELLLRLHLGGMIATTNRKEATVSFFAVVKKLQEVGMLDRSSSSNSTRGEARGSSRSGSLGRYLPR